MILQLYQEEDNKQPPSEPVRGENGSPPHPTIPGGPSRRTLTTDVRDVTGVWQRRSPISKQNIKSLETIFLTLQKLKKKSFKSISLIVNKPLSLPRMSNNTIPTVAGGKRIVCQPPFLLKKFTE